MNRVLTSGQSMFLLVAAMAVNASAANPPSAGPVVGWGANWFDQASGPQGTFKAVAASYFHSVALREDGTLVAWGDNQFGQIQGVPTGAFQAVSSTYAHSIALRADGSLAAWGDNRFGQTSNVPQGLFKAVAAGHYHSVAIRVDGTLAAWGADWFGQTTQAPQGTFKAVSSGTYHSVALRADGTLVAWGDDQFGQKNAPNGNDFVAVAAGGYHNVALRANGTLVAWGENTYGQIGYLPQGTFAAIAAGYYHSVALREDGTVVAWGYDAQGQVSGTPRGAGHLAVSAGGYHNLALKEPPNQPPVADAGSNQTIWSGPVGATVQLNGSGTDPDGDALEFEWSAAPGVTIANPASASSSAHFPSGTHEVTLTVYDLKNGVRTGASSSAKATVIVLVDAAAPIVELATDLTSLSPPNNKMVTVTIAVRATDDRTVATPLSVECKVTSSQPDQTSDDPTMVGDVNGQDGYTVPVSVTLTLGDDGVYHGVVNLRAERAGSIQTGRVYSITVRAADQVGNCTPASTTVVVPHDRRK